MGEPNADELIRTTLDRRTEELRATLAADLETAWSTAWRPARRRDSPRGEFRGRKQGVIRRGDELPGVRGLIRAVVAKAAELPEPIIKKLAQDNGIEIA